MTSTELALARQLAKHPAFQWREGMRWIRDDGDSGRYPDADPALVEGVAVPDLADSATLGGLFFEVAMAIWVDAVARNLGAGATAGEAIARAWLAGR